MEDRDRVHPEWCLSYPTPRKVDLDALDLPDQFPQRSLQLAEPVVELAVSGGHGTSHAIHNALDNPVGISDRISALSSVGDNFHFPNFALVSKIGNSPHKYRLPTCFA